LSNKSTDKTDTTVSGDTPDNDDNFDAADSDDDCSPIFFDVDDSSNADFYVDHDGTTYCAYASEQKSRQRSTKFDTDAVPIKIDNCASACMTNTFTEFSEPPQRIKNIPIASEKETH
jgi:hypothetical protein